MDSVFAAMTLGISLCLSLIGMACILSQSLSTAIQQAAETLAEALQKKEQ